MPMRELVGRTFGRLTVVAEVPAPRKDRRVECKCECGTITTKKASLLLSGDATSCGCYWKELWDRGIRRTHGMTKSPEYSAWSSMRARCNNANNPVYAHYGARGISVCGRWKSFDAFLSDMGPRPSRC